MRSPDSRHARQPTGALAGQPHQDALERATRSRFAETIHTTGDKITDVPLAAAGGTKALFTKEIEEALLARRIDLAVHSLKDLPVELPTGLTIGAVPAREDARDALISRHGQPLAALPAGARVGTSSLRRQLQLQLLRKDLAIEPLRGNLDTRLRKLDEGQYDAIVVAMAGLKRLGWADRATQILSADEMIPAIGQGALAIEIRSDDKELHGALESLRDLEAESCVRAERAFLRRLGGGCQVPLAAHATVKREQVRLVGVVVSLDAARAVRGADEGPEAEAETIECSSPSDCWRMAGARFWRDCRGRAAAAGSGLMRRKTLAGRRIVITRRAEQAGSLHRALKTRRAEPLARPTLELAPPRNWRPVDAAIQRLPEYDWVIFTSVNGVESFAARLRKNGKTMSALRRALIAAIGPATARALRAHGLRVRVVPEEFRAEGLVRALQRVKWSGKRAACTGGQSTSTAAARITASQSNGRCGGSLSYGCASGEPKTNR
jgi:hydroxymethylbilane synthase